MKISKEALIEFKRICRDELGRTLTDAEALDAAHRVLILAELMIKADALPRQERVGQSQADHRPLPSPADRDD